MIWGRYHRRLVRARRPSLMKRCEWSTKYNFGPVSWGGVFEPNPMYQMLFGKSP